MKLDSLEAQLRPVEQLDKRTPRGKSSLLRGNRVLIIMEVLTCYHDCPVNFMIMKKLTKVILILLLSLMTTCTKDTHESSLTDDYVIVDSVNGLSSNL
jgi:hypothetical protein